MRTNSKLATIDDVVAGTAQFNEDVYDHTDGGYRLKSDILAKVNAEAAFRWGNGGREIHDKWMADPAFAETEEFKDYFRKWCIQCP